MSSKTYPEIKTKIDATKPNVSFIMIQASNPGGEPLTEAQYEAARNAAASVLEVLGAEVASQFQPFTIDIVPPGESGYFVFQCSTHTEPDPNLAELDAEGDEE